MRYAITNKSTDALKVILEVTKGEKELTETILNLARDNGALKDVLVFYDLREGLAKKLSDNAEQYSNEIIIKKIQENQKAENRAFTASVFVLVGGLVLAAVFNPWIALAAIFISMAVCYGTYEYNQPNSKMVEEYSAEQVKNVGKSLGAET